MALLATFLVLVTLGCMSASHVRDVTEGTELVLAFMVHRHGDRTPVAQVLSMLKDAEALEELIQPWGYGQLTNVGRRTGYKTGQFIRRRYDELLSPVYNKSEIFVRSTDAERTKMTTLAALAAVYPALGDTWSEDINWVPVPYTTVPAKYDFNAVTLNCPNYLSNIPILLAASATKMDKYKDLIVKLSDILGMDLTGTPAVSYVIYDLYLSLISLGVDLDDKIKALMPELEAACTEAMDLLSGNDEYLPLQSGVLLKEFFDVASKVIAGNDTQRVRVYSAHDVNVYSFEAITQVYPRQGLPRYGSVFALELRRVVETEQYVVLPVYLPSPDEQEIYLPVESCGLLCNLDAFAKITSKYVLDEDTWRTKCGWTPDLDVSSSDFD